MLFELRNVSKNYGIHRIFRGVNFGLDRGTFSILTGPSGSGKTTFFRMLCGVEKPTEGEIVFLGRKLHHQYPSVHLKQIGFVFQNPRGIADWSVFQNIEVPLVVDGVPKKDREKKVIHWLEVMGLRARAQSPYRELSGGEVQKAEFARAMIRKPRLILADEPTAHLDSIQADLLMDLLWEHYQDGATVFISTHHPPPFEHTSILRYHISQLSIKRISGGSSSRETLIDTPSQESVNEIESPELFS